MAAHTRNRSTTSAVAAEVKAGIQKLGLSATSFAKKTGLDRNFINGVLSGKSPRVKEGHLTAEHDSRYKKLSAALGYSGDETKLFIDRVKAEQTQQIIPSDISRPANVSAYANRVWEVLLPKLPQQTTILTYLRSVWCTVFGLSEKELASAAEVATKILWMWQQPPKTGAEKAIDSRTAALCKMAEVASSTQYHILAPSVHSQITTILYWFMNDPDTAWKYCAPTQDKKEIA